MLNTDVFINNCLRIANQAITKTLFIAMRNYLTLYVLTLRNLSK